MKGWAASIVLVLLLSLPVFCAEEGVLLLNADFEDADLSGWRIGGDLCVAPSFCAGQPSGRYWVAFSTNSSKGDPITMCGGSAVEGLETILRSPHLLLPFKPGRIRVDFTVKFLTNENTVSDLGTDSLVVRLLTKAGPVVIAAIDDSGAAPGSRNLVIQGDSTFHESSCNPTWKYETGLLHVSYYRAFHEPVLSKMASGPIALEFSLSNHFDQDFDSAVVLDDVRLRVYR